MSENPWSGAPECSGEPSPAPGEQDSASLQFLVKALAAAVAVVATEHLGPGAAVASAAVATLIPDFVKEFVRRRGWGPRRTGFVLGIFLLFDSYLRKAILSLLRALGGGVRQGTSVLAGGWAQVAATSIAATLLAVGGYAAAQGATGDKPFSRDASSAEGESVPEEEGPAPGSDRRKRLRLGQSIILGTGSETDDAGAGCVRVPCQVRVTLLRVVDPVEPDPESGLPGPGDPTAGDRGVGFVFRLENVAQNPYDQLPSNDTRLSDRDDDLLGLDKNEYGNPDCDANRDADPPTKLQPGATHIVCVVATIHKKEKPAILSYELQAQQAPNQGTWSLSP